MWCSFVEPKFGYGIGLWLAGSDNLAMSTIDRIQCIGAQQLLGVSVPSKWTCRPANVSMLMESGLSPACVLRARGLLGLWRVAQSREPQSLLGMAWGSGEEYRMQLGRECINNAVKEIVREHAGDVEWPEPDLKKEWKEVIGEVSNKVLRAWYRREVKSSVTGRRAEYGLIREAEVRAEYAMQPRAHLHTAQRIAQHLLDTMPSTPAPFTKLSLSAIDVSIITRMRCHMLSCIRTHCGHQTHTHNCTRYPPITHWHMRTCVFCTGSCLDDNAHFLLRCPFHASARLVLLQSIRTAIIQAGARFQWEDYDRFPTMQVHTLLGVGESTVALREAGNGLLTKIVGAAAKFALRASRERARAGT